MFLPPQKTQIRIIANYGSSLSIPQKSSSDGSSGAKSNKRVQAQETDTDYLLQVTQKALLFKTLVELNKNSSNQQSPEEFGIKEDICRLIASPIAVTFNPNMEK